MIETTGMSYKATCVALSLYVILELVADTIAYDIRSVLSASWTMEYNL